MSEVRSNGHATATAPLSPAAVGPVPQVVLPPRVPRQAYRPAQSDIPDEKTVRARLKEAIRIYTRLEGLTPPLTMDELREHTATVLKRVGLDPVYKDYAAVLLSNAAWADALAQVPFDRRLLLLPKCLRVEDKCPAPFDEFGLLCKECGLCSIQDLSVEAERLGYAVLVAEGSAIVRKMIETGKIEAVVGVSCLNVLEKCFPHMEAAAIPSIAIPLLQDDCINTTVDLDWVWDVIHLTADDKTYRLDLEALKADVRAWFTRDALDELLGPCATETDEIARDWLARDGKRWRPYLAACTALALEASRHETPPPPSRALRQTAVAIECFHKASLIHDDIEDADTQRYGMATLHTERGVPIALNVGDFLLGLGYRLLAEADVDPVRKVEMLRLAACSHETLSRGQGTELCWAENRRVLTSLEILDIFRMKTAPAFEVALRLGACLGGADEETHEVLQKYSEALGIAYQINDDIEDHSDEGDSHDLDAIRPSLILAIAHKRAVEGAQQDLIARLWRGEIPYADVREEVREILEDRGVLEKADDLLAAYKEEAIRSLRFIPNATLKGLLRRVVGKMFSEQLIEGYCSEFEARNATSRAAGPESAPGSVAAGR
ncbi:MAG: polyprenyl synthetase family protein [Candidatus Hydrogenedentes bacterium]|nr:polyprenyl synthetase family protein [Candidatus Hydrogenedentota bacterium]